jgi:hypothetical protein
MLSTYWSTSELPLGTWFAELHPPAARPGDAGTIQAAPKTATSTASLRALTFIALSYALGSRSLTGNRV